MNTTASRTITSIAVIETVMFTGRIRAQVSGRGQFGFRKFAGPGSHRRPFHSIPQSAQAGGQGRALRPEVGGRYGKLAGGGPVAGTVLTVTLRAMSRIDVRTEIENILRQRGLRLRHVKSAHHLGNGGQILRRKIAPRRHCRSHIAVPERRSQTVQRVFVFGQICRPGMQTSRTRSIAFAANSVATGAVPGIEPLAALRSPDELNFG